MWLEITTYSLLIAYAVIVIGTAIVILLENRQPAKTIAWLLVLIVLPVIGWVFFYFFGQNVRKERHLHKRNFQILTHLMHTAKQQPPPHELPEAYVPLITAMQQHKGAYPTMGNELRLLESGADFIIALLRAIRAARHHIHVESYIFEDDPVGRLVRDALTDSARRGVEVRVIYDDVGCWRVPQRFFDEMTQNGIQAEAFLPVRFPSLTSKVNYRNHRKICIIDGVEGFIGGMNIAQRYVSRRKGLWTDLQLHIKGAAVGALQRTFLTDWHIVTEALITERSYFPDNQGMHRGGLMQIIDATPVSQYPEIEFGLVWVSMHAKRYLYLQTPYFMPTEPMLNALKVAALAGTDVRIMVPQKPDAFWLRLANDSYFSDLLKAGIRVFTYSPGFLHSKSAVADDTWCSVGSSNIDFRSFENNFESNAFVYDADTAQQMRDIFLRNQQECEEMVLKEWRKRPLLNRYIESVTRIMSPLF